MVRYLLILAVLAWPSIGQARSVFLNGANIDSVKNKTFTNCTVKIDAHGNVLIEAKGYAVKGASGTDEAPPAQAGLPPTRKYFLVTEKAAPGMSQYDVELFINNKYVRKFLSAEEHVVMEITKYLKTGSNKIRFIARKDKASGVRRSQSPQHYFRIIIGEGEPSGRKVMITKKAIDYKRTALETKDFNEEQSIMVY